MFHAVFIEPPVICLCRHFDVKDKSENEAAKLFSVPDFVGDACKAIASRIRGAVAGVQFDDFHKVENNINKQQRFITTVYNHAL